jgi:hypothetical protein
MCPPYGVRSDFRDNWDTDELEFFSRYDGLLYFRLNPLGAYCLEPSDQYRPAEVDKPPLLEIDEDLLFSPLRPVEPAECMMLDRYAQRLSSDAWQLTAESILQAMADGQDPELFRDFLRDRADGGLPAEADDIFAAAADRLSALADAGPARLIRCSSPALAEMIADDPQTRAPCLPAGGTLLAIPDNKEKAFRAGLRRLGYVFPKIG